MASSTISKKEVTDPDWKTVITGEMIYFAKFMCAKLPPPPYA